jgi:hypothetical protein
MEGLAAAASAIIALLALGVSIAVAVNQARIAREQTAIQKRLAAIEEARRAEEVAARSQARVTASVFRGSYLTLRNEGSAIARKVQAEITSLDGDPVPTFDGIEALPVDLQPAQPIHFEILQTMGDAYMVRVIVRWTDESGGHEEPYTLRLGYA